MPALWDEPFGLTTIEALLSGTPVLGTRRGALPEVLTPAVGALCDTLDEMVVAADTIHTRDPSACRAHAERYFTHLVMAEEYTRLYRRLLETGRLPPGRPAPHLATAGRPSAAPPCDGATYARAAPAPEPQRRASGGRARRPGARALARAARRRSRTERSRAPA